jgi:hypothetical protein
VKISKAISLSLSRLEKPLITEYELGLLLVKLYKDKSFDGQELNISRDTPDSQSFRSIVSNLQSDSLLNTSRALPKGVYSLFGHSKWDAREGLCIVDPFCYLSHLSAMEYHGLTDRLPKTIFITSPGTKDWKSAASLKMQKDLGGDLDNYTIEGLPSLKQLSLSTFDVSRYAAKPQGNFKTVRGSPLRVSNAGRTFLDMIRKPDLCGGIRHVLDVYEEHASRYLKLITNEVDAHGTMIEKARAGYILEERMGIKDNPAVNSWEESVQRGGSRKLDPQGEYRSIFSEKWCISVNI